MNTFEMIHLPKLIIKRRRLIYAFNLTSINRDITCSSEYFEPIYLKKNCDLN